METEICFGRRPPQTSENSIKTANSFSPKPDNQFFEDLLQLRAKYRLRQRYTNLPSEDRILPPEESQETQNTAEHTVFPSVGSISFHNDLEHIDNLHTRFGTTGKQRLAHDPVMERARYERAETDEERQAVKRGVIADMEKTLYERAHTAKSTVTYYQDNEGRIYNPDFPGESFDVVLQRGLGNSERNGFVDYEREVVEFEGWKEVMAKLFVSETPVGSKDIVISGPGSKKGTAFTYNFVDIYTKTINSATGRVVVVMTRFASGVGYGEYARVAMRLDKNYFRSERQQEEGKEDIFYQAHPIFIDSRVDSRTDEQLFSEEFTKQKGATEEEKTKHYLDECKLFILHYAETICSKFFEPESVKIAFNAVINKFDSLRKGFVETAKNAIKGVFEFGRNMAERILDFGHYIEDQIDYYGKMKVEEVMVGCGLLSGFSIGGSGFSIGGMIKSLAGIISGAIKGILGIFSKDKDYCINCGACGEEIKCVVRKGEHCPKCRAVRKC